jgi:phosphoglycerate kinase
MLKMNEIDLSGKRVLIRVDLNVPMSNGIIENDSRIKATIPTIKLALQSNCSIILMSHMGRPKEGIFEEDLSLNSVAENLSSALKRV